MVPCSFNLPREAIFFFFKFPYWLKEHFRGLKSISLFTEAIKTSLQLFPVALALKQEHSGTSNYSFEEHSLSSRARHFPSHSLQFRQPGHCRWQVSQNQTIQWTASKPATRTLWAGFRLTAGLPPIFQGHFIDWSCKGHRAGDQWETGSPTWTFSEHPRRCCTTPAPPQATFSPGLFRRGFAFRACSLPTPPSS